MSASNSSAYRSERSFHQTSSSSSSSNPYVEKSHGMFSEDFGPFVRPGGNTLGFSNICRWKWEDQSTRGFVPVHGGRSRLLPGRRHRHHVQQPNRSPCGKVGPGRFGDEHIHPQVSAARGRGPHLGDVISGRRGDAHGSGAATPGQT
ncbi:heat shock protein beta-7 isoform X2 [Phycodurus eques]|uniref:heat shock protein beta-7 isoform X2 n=1 Tax=Phycodurus eques TaxID=693459 RepID=UPI002ACE8A31|nr:heat shock protein beta-7 isoform X2 [Phycodurus eques]